VTTSAIRLEGVIPILSMPFAEDEAIDFQGLADQVEYLVSAGIHGIGLGFGSELFRLTEKERDEAMRFVAGRVAGRLPVVVGVSGGSTRAALDRAAAARQAGADVLMVTPPAPGQPAPDDIVAYYARMSEAIHLPIMVQDAPGMTGVELPASLLVRLATEIERVVAIKVEALPSAPKVGEVVAGVGDRIAVLGGAGGFDFFHELGRGACGTIPGAALPERFVRVWELFRRGERDAARSAFNRFLPLLTLAGRSLDTFLFVQKEILRRQGVLRAAAMRSPWRPPDAELLTELDALLRDLDAA
jgi:2-keto-3-deoxy-L-arabinonate dehydratase